MSFNGAGVFQRIYSWTNDAAANIKIRADRMDAEFNGIAQGLTNCITKDGQTTVTANLPMAGFKHTGVANASASTEYAAYGQLTAALAAITLDGISDVVLTSVASGDFIYYNGTNWVNVAKTVVPIDGIKTTGSSGVILKNSAGTTVLTAGASAGTVTAMAGNLTVGGTIVGSSSLSVSSTLSAVGSLAIAGTSTAAAVITLAEDTDNGTNKVTITPPQVIASDYTLTLPSTAGTLSLETNGKQADSTYAEYTTNAALTTQIPLDDTIPQNTEGDQILSATITPKTATNKVRIRVTGAGALSSNGSYVVAVYGSGVNALAAWAVNTPTTNSPVPYAFEFEHSPASATLQTYTVRVGATSALTLRMNGTSAARLLGGVSRCTITLEEVVA